MSEEKDSWGEYGKLVLKELERLNETYSEMRIDMDRRFNELTHKLTEFKATENKVTNHDGWIDRVNDVWSPNQMKEAKDEIYRQKTRWAATIAIISFLQIAIGIGVTIWVKLR